MKTADEMIQWYSSMTTTEQRKFDKRYRDLMRFRRNLKTLTQFVKAGGDVGKLTVGQVKAIDGRPE
jgi:hypothetical protein